MHISGLIGSSIGLQIGLWLVAFMRVVAASSQVERGLDPYEI
jgi:hypothetical protein